jgi:hypothetical protein
MKNKEMARSVLHFALNIFSLSLSYFQKYFVTSVQDVATTVGKLSICRLYTGGSFPSFEGPKARITENTEKSLGN